MQNLIKIGQIHNNAHNKIVKIQVKSHFGVSYKRIIELYISMILYE